jgi:hypothetical protein
MMPQTPRKFRDLSKKQKKALIREYHGILARLTRQLHIGRGTVQQVTYGQQSDLTSQATIERVLDALDAEFAPVLARRGKAESKAVA